MLSSCHADRMIWEDGLRAFDQCEYAIAKDHFSRLGNFSKALYNVAICHVAVGDMQESKEALKRSTLADPYLAVAHFHLGHLYFMEKDYNGCIKCLEDVIKCMRGDATIDYTQTGLDCCLYASEVWFNHGICKTYLGLQSEALQSFVNAHDFKRLVRHDIVDEAMKAGWKEYLPFPPPNLAVFRPKRLNLLQGSSLLGSIVGEPAAMTMHNLETSGRKIVAVAPGEVQPVLTDFGHVSRMSKPSLNPSLTQSNDSFYRPETPDTLETKSIIRISHQKEEGRVENRVTFFNRKNGVGGLFSSLKKKLGVDQVKIKYQDSQGDLVNLVDDDDFQCIIDLMWGKMESKERFTLICC